MQWNHTFAPCAAENRAAFAVDLLTSTAEGEGGFAFPSAGEGGGSRARNFEGMPIGEPGGKLPAGRGSGVGRSY